MQDYNKLPKQPNVDQVFLLDPLIATGGTVCAALNMIKDWGCPSECETSVRPALSVLDLVLRFSE